MYIRRFVVGLLESFRRIPIKRKLILLMMVVAVVSVGLTTFASALFGVVHLKQSEEKELIVLAKIIGDKNAAAMAFNNPLLAKANLDIMASKSSVRKACIFNIDGDVFAEYPVTTRLGMLCPRLMADGITIKDKQLKVYHSVYKKGTYLGSVYIKSDLQAVNGYLARIWGVSAVIIAVICLISYLIILRLQRVISNPIKVLSEDVKAIFNEGYSARTRAIYYDELGDIAESFNKILEEREHNHKEFFAKAEEYDHISRSAEKTLATLDDEAIFPFKAATTFKALLEKEVFGPVNPMYHNYFNDVYTAEVELYYILAKALDSLRLQSSLLTAEKEGIALDTLVKSIVDESFKRLGDPRISYIFSAQPLMIYKGYLQPLKRFIENIVALLIDVKSLGRLYECRFEVQQRKAGSYYLAVSMREKDAKAIPCNDNYLAIPLKELIHKLKHNEPLPVAHEEYFANLGDVNVRSRLYSIEFLSNINHAEVEVKLSSHVLTLDVHLAAKIGVKTLEKH